MKTPRRLLFIVLLSAAFPALAQFTQQGPRLVGTGGGFSQGASVALSAYGSTAIVGGTSSGVDGLGAAWIWTRSGGVWTQQGPSWSARVQSEAHSKVLPYASLLMATRPSSEAPATMAALGQRGSLREEEERGLSKAPNWLAQTQSEPPVKAVRYPSPPMATQPSLEGLRTTI
jgi:hypothetical protein